MGHVSHGVSLTMVVGMVGALALISVGCRTGADEPTPPIVDKPDVTTPVGPPTKAQEALEAANNRFGFALLAKLLAAQGKDNVFISPSSIAMCLDMAPGRGDRGHPAGDDEDPRADGYHPRRCEPGEPRSAQGSGRSGQRSEALDRQLAVAQERDQLRARVHRHRRQVLRGEDLGPRLRQPRRREDDQRLGEREHWREDPQHREERPPVGLPVRARQRRLLRRAMVGRVR